MNPLREKSSNTSAARMTSTIDLWLSSSSQQKSKATYNDEEEAIRKAKEESLEYYKAQQKREWAYLKSRASSSDLIDGFPAIDNIDEWFQPTSPPRSLTRRSATPNTARSPGKKQKRDTDNAISLTNSSTSIATIEATSIKEETQSTEDNDTWEIGASQLAKLKKEERNTDDSWEIQFDQIPTQQVKDEHEEEWEIHFDQLPKQEHSKRNLDSEWEISFDQLIKQEDNKACNRQPTEPLSEEDTSTNKDNVGDDDDSSFQQYVNAIYNRATKEVPASRRRSSREQVHKGPATRLDDVFYTLEDSIGGSQRQRKKRVCVTHENDPTYIPPTSYQTQFTRRGTLEDEYAVSSSSSTLTRQNTLRAKKQSSNEAHGPSSTSMDISPRKPDQVGPHVIDDSESDCSSIIDLCSADNSDNGHDNDDDLFFSTALETNDSYRQSEASSMTRSPSRQTSSKQSSEPTSGNSADHDDDSGYLSPLEGFVSLLDQANDATNRHYFEQLTPSSTSASSSRSRNRPSYRRRPTGSSNRGKRRFSKARKRTYR